MNTAPVLEDFANWSPEGHDFTVRYRLATLRDMVAQAAEGFALIPRGGVEVAGVLFGRREGPTTVTVEACRTLSCDYRNGPSFEFDDSNLGEVLAAASQDPSLTGMEPVGWWQSHTRTEIALSDGEVAFFNRYFPAVWQVAAIVRPAQLQPTRIGFFFREPDGSVHASSSYAEFTLPRAPRSQHATDARELVPAGRSGEPRTVTFVPAPVIAALPPVASGTTPKRRRPILEGFAAVLLIALAAAGLWQFWPRQGADIALRITGKANTVFIEWDTTAAAVQRSQSADLEIRDGEDGPRYFRLDRRQLRAGRISYVRSSPEVTARMRLYGWGDDSKDWVASFIGPALPGGSEPPIIVQAKPPEVTQQPLPEQKLAAPPPDVAPTPVAPQPQKAAPRPVLREVATANRTVVPPPSTAPERLPNIPAPHVATSAPIQLNAPLGIAPQTNVAPPPAPPQTQAQPVRTARIERVPRSGRAIWTGDLRSGGVLLFANAKPSFGNLTGQLPSGPVRLTAHAAELGDHGIVIYSADPRMRDREGAYESPSARNGWNLTTYKWDPRRARDLATVEAPGPGNEWKRLAVRNAGRKISVIVLDWEELPAVTPVTEARQ